MSRQGRRYHKRISLKYNCGLINVLGDENQYFFRCLAIFKGADRLDCKTKTRELFAQYSAVARAKEVRGH